MVESRASGDACVSTVVSMVDCLSRTKSVLHSATLTRPLTTPCALLGAKSPTDVHIVMFSIASNVETIVAL